MRQQGKAFEILNLNKVINNYSYNYVECEHTE